VHGPKVDAVARLCIIRQAAQRCGRLALVASCWAIGSTAAVVSLDASRGNATTTDATTSCTAASALLCVAPQLCCCGGGSGVAGTEPHLSSAAVSILAGACISIAIRTGVPAAVCHCRTGGQAPRPPARGPSPPPAIAMSMAAAAVTLLAVSLTLRLAPLDVACSCRIPALGEQPAGLPGDHLEEGQRQGCKGWREMEEPVHC